MMIRVGLTMRLDPTPHGEWRNTLDAHWPTLLMGLGFIPVLLPNRGMAAADMIASYGLGAIILTGGNDVLPDGETYSADRNDFESALMDVAAAQKMPVIGICRGLQMMNLYCGGTVVPVPGHVRIDHDVNWSGTDYRVNSYHNFGIGVLADGLGVTATAPDGTVEAVCHKTLPWAAIMWHPERDIDRADIHHQWLARALSGDIS